MLEFDMTQFYMGIRAAGAVLLANSLVIPALSDWKNPNWWILFLVGGTMLLLTSFRKKAKNG